MRALLVSPRTPDTFWSFRHALPFVGRKAAFPPLGLLTVAALLPPDWELRLVDQDVRALRDEDLRWSEIVLLSGMIVHRDSVEETVARARALGRKLVGGGPLFTTGHEGFPEVDHVLLGEAEELVAEFLSDLAAGRARRVYAAAERPDLARSPIPRWQLLDLADYASASVQFSRGCPFDCEFCDIVVMNGRKPRTKAVPQLLAELDAILAQGWDGPVFVVDDNFIGHKPRVREMLRALMDWRERTGSRMTFTTEVSVDLARDAELLDFMVRAGFKKVFVGLETPDRGALAECGKSQNLRQDLGSAVRTLQNAGLEVMGGFIVGFDHDGPDIFERQFRFIQDSGIASAMVGLLTALPRTRLWERLQREGRLIADSHGNNTLARLNFVPRLERGALESGYGALLRHLYEPATFYRRLRVLLRNYRPGGPAPRLSRMDLRAAAGCLWTLGVRRSGRCQYWWTLLLAASRGPRSFAVAVTQAIYGYHFRKVAAELGPARPISP